MSYELLILVDTKIQGSRDSEIQGFIDAEIQ
jgi:hypothetical protein